MQHKFIRIGQLALEKDDLVKFVLNLENIRDLNNADLSNIYDCSIKFTDDPIDGDVQNE